MPVVPATIPDAGAPIRVLVVDDHGLVRLGLQSLLDAQDDMRVVAAAGNGYDAVELTCRHDPDVVLMDLVMPAMDGVRATRRLLDARPGTPVIVLTSFPDRDLVGRAMSAGASGYLLKDAHPGVLLGAVRAAAERGRARRGAPVRPAGGRGAPASRRR